MWTRSAVQTATTGCGLDVGWCGSLALVILACVVRHAWTATPRNPRHGGCNTFWHLELVSLQLSMVHEHILA
jgi:hypothetical protein